MLLSSVSWYNSSYELMTSSLVKHVTSGQMRSILDHSISDQTRVIYKDHINACQVCWSLWNKARWDRAMKTKGVKELHGFLGKSFSTYYDSSWALAKEWNGERRVTKENIETFYQKTSNYLYNLVLFYESGDRKNFKPLFHKLARNKQLKTVLDYGCGVGSDSLDLVEAGFRVLSTDFESPSLDFLRWRLGKRGIGEDRCLVIPVEELASRRDECLQADVFWGVDVLEHMFDPFEVLQLISSDIKVFAYYVDSDDKANGRHPFHFKFPVAAFEERLRMWNLKPSPEDDDTISIWTREL